MEAVSQRIKDLGRASGQRAHVSVHDWRTHIAASKSVLASACAAVGLDYDGALLVQVTLDTTPVSVRQRYALNVGAAKRARSSKGPADLLVGAVSLSRVEVSGEITSRLLLDEPIVVKGSKTKEMMASCFLALPGINMASPEMTRFRLRHI
eukprot:6477893-Amphidinium_carterae.1